MRGRVVGGVVVAAVAVLVVVVPAAEVAAGGWWSLLPPVVAISLALVFRDVVVSLFVGVWLGATMLADGAAGAGLLRVVDTSMLDALTNPDNISILVFSMLLGGMVGVMSRSGGTRGVVVALEPLATTPRRAQLATWLMGLAIFFDDYSNTLIVGNSMRPITDRHRISREKLAFLVDSTAAPVATLALISTWVGTQISLLGTALDGIGSDLNPAAVFLHSIPYAFYPIFALVATLVVALGGRDWGPMAAAERRAAGGRLLADSARPLADFDSEGLAPDEETPPRWYNAALPVVVVVVVTVWGLIATGRAQLAADGVATATARDVIGAADPFASLLWASLTGAITAVVLAVGQRLLTLGQAMDALVAGFRSMLMAAVVLTLAWSLGGVCADLATADFLKGAVGPHVPPGLLPMAVFLVAAGVSFATGTSWGTMAILTPLAIPLVVRAGEGETALVAATVASILGGSVFGDHCSPISDTTIMSSMASGCDHVDHVRTQLPYALAVALVAIVCGYLPSGLTELPAGIDLVLGSAVLVVLFRLLGRRSGSHAETA